LTNNTTMKKFTDKQLLSMENDIAAVCDKMRRLHAKYKISDRMRETYDDWSDDSDQAIAQRFNDVDGFLDDFWHMLYSINRD